MNLAKRVASALVLLPLVLGAIHWGGWAFFAVLVVALAISLHEGLGLVVPDASDRRIQAMILGATLGALAGLILQGSGFLALGLAVLLLGSALSAAAVVARGSGGFMDVYKTAKTPQIMMQKVWVGANNRTEPWGVRRENFIKRHMAQYTKKPTKRRRLALLMWAFDPDVSNTTQRTQRN